MTQEHLIAYALNGAYAELEYWKTKEIVFMQTAKTYLQTWML